VLFLGDYLDRGPEIPAGLRLVSALVEAGEAVALMGNHEFNSVALDHRVNGRPLLP
jgi:predicted MPP superfamily phosphohydrolase